MTKNQMKHAACVAGSALCAAAAIYFCWEGSELAANGAKQATLIISAVKVGLASLVGGALCLVWRKLPLSA